jgi:hypothetical protein
MRGSVTTGAPRRSGFDVDRSRSRRSATWSATGSAKRPSPGTQPGHHRPMYTPEEEQRVADEQQALDDDMLLLAALAGAEPVLGELTPYGWLEVDQGWWDRWAVVTTLCRRDRCPASLACLRLPGASMGRGLDRGNWPGSWCGVHVRGGLGRPSSRPACRAIAGRGPGRSRLCAGTNGHGAAVASSLPRIHSRERVPARSRASCCDQRRVRPRLVSG